MYYYLAITKQEQLNTNFSYSEYFFLNKKNDEKKRRLNLMLQVRLYYDKGKA